MTASTLPCPGCGVEPSQQHKGGCDVARCTVCGIQEVQCDPETERDLFEGDRRPMQTWTGTWPGLVECREWGWWARWTLMSGYGRDGIPDTGASVPCSPDHPHAHEDLNRLLPAAARGEILWSREQERYVLPAFAAEPEAGPEVWLLPVGYLAVRVGEQAWQLVTPDARGQHSHEVPADSRRARFAAAATVDELEDHFLEANEKMGQALVEIGMALGLPRPAVGAMWGAPEILARISDRSARTDGAHVAVDDPGILWMAMRYALGRHTYAAAEIAEAIELHVDQIDVSARERMAIEIEQAGVLDAHGSALAAINIHFWDRAVRALRGGGPTTQEDPT